ncbi:Protein kinase superfamily protein [Prunus dulcis]|uniref:Protein kinase superfamily protein n=1 Tax=Prunus dulcis TaxID=3755 RepID=A0A4Y1RWQ2_PRUDU|nr:Protein kinase superfamily protein [Prunus dulcis]
MRSPPVDPVATRACKTGVSVPVFTTAALALKADRITTKEVVGRGFELGLQIDNVQCKSCVESGGKCGLNTTSRGFCFCLDEPYATICNAKGMFVPGHSLTNYRIEFQDWWHRQFF